MKQFLRAGVLLLWMSGILAAQEDAKELLRKALEASKGGMKMEGEVTGESPLPVRIPGLEGAMTGRLSAVVGANDAMIAKIEGEGISYEVFRRGDRLVQRQTWTDRRPALPSLAREISSAVSLSSLSRHLDRAKEFKRGADRRLGDTECTVLQAVYPARLVSEEEEEPTHGLRLRLLEVKRVEAELWVAKDDGKIRRIELKLVKGLGAMVRFRMPGRPEEDEEEEVPGLDLGNFSTTYSLTITSYEPTAEVRFPPEIARLLED